AHPHLQLPARPRLGPPHQSHAAQAAADSRRRSAGRDHRRAGHREPGGAARGRRGKLMPRADAATLAKPDDTAARTVAEARRTLAANFHAGGLDTPDLDARILVGHALGLDRGALAAGPAHSFGADD